jgi:uncharacterized protein (DUF362 family)
MFETGINVMGGMGRFIKKGQSVVVKPNIGWNKTPEQGANTNPGLVGRIIKECYAAGAGKVYVFDNTCNQWQRCYANSGIEQAVKDNGGIMVPGNDEKRYRKLTMKGTKVLKDVAVHELWLDSDVLIDVPVLKHHGGARMTAAIKNMMGVVWDRHFWHRTDLQQCIGEFPLVRKPDLVIVDANTVMTKNGPRGVSKADLELRKMQLITTDLVAADAAAAKILGHQAGAVQYIDIAAGLGLGNADLTKQDIRRLDLAG